MEMVIAGKKSQKCVLYDVLYVPDLAYNLVSVSKIVKRGKVIEFKNDKCQIRYQNGKKIGVANKFESLYYLDCTCYENAVCCTSVKKSSFDLKRDRIRYSRFIGRDPPKQQLEYCSLAYVQNR